MITLTKRIAFVARLAYWTVRHRSVDSALWLIAFEGYTW
jgi:hypothetical protein